MDLYCAHCDGIVNRGGACPRAERPNGCPLELTEREHYAELAAQTAAADDARLRIQVERLQRVAAPATPQTPVA